MNAKYIFEQYNSYQRFDLAGNKKAADDCLYRVAVNADLIDGVATGVTDANRPEILGWIDRNIDAIAPLTEEDRDVLRSLTE